MRSGGSVGAFVLDGLGGTGGEDLCSTSPGTRGDAERRGSKAESSLSLMEANSRPDIVESPAVGVVCSQLSDETCIGESSGDAREREFWLRCEDCSLGSMCRSNWKGRESVVGGVITHFSVITRSLLSYLGSSGEHHHDSTCPPVLHDSSRPMSPPYRESEIARHPYGAHDASKAKLQRKDQADHRKASKEARWAVAWWSEALKEK